MSLVCGEVVFTKRLEVCFGGGEFRGSAKYAVKDRKRDAFVVMVLGVTDGTKPFEVDPVLGGIGFHFLEGGTEVPAWVTENRRRAVFGEPPLTGEEVAELAKKSEA